MKNVIIQTAANTYEMTIRGARMVLERRASPCGEWHMTTDNAAARAWSRVIMPKSFATLAEVEARYKSWRGIVALVEAA